jgi:hypothetical protein
VQSALDQAITDASTAEATYLSSAANVSSIQTAIAAATTPLAPAQTQLASDAANFNAKLAALAAAATAAEIPIPPAPTA